MYNMPESIMLRTADHYNMYVFQGQMTLQEITIAMEHQHTMPFASLVEHPYEVSTPTMQNELGTTTPVPTNLFFYLFKRNTHNFESPK